jgi:hypothetical protein
MNERQGGGALTVAVAQAGGDGGALKAPDELAPGARVD